MAENTCPPRPRVKRTEPGAPPRPLPPVTSCTRPRFLPRPLPQPRVPALSSASATTPMLSPGLSSTAPRAWPGTRCRSAWQPPPGVTSCAATSSQPLFTAGRKMLSLLHKHISEGTDNGWEIPKKASGAVKKWDH